MKKRLGSILLALAIALSLVPAFAPEARAETEMPGGEFGEGLRWEISNGTLGVYGDGAMPDYRGSDQPWYAYRTSITSLIVGNGITKIGNFAFAGLWSLEEATFYDSLTYIGQFAFSGCGKLAVAELPDSLTDLCSRAFINCSALEEITIPGGVKTIGQSAFSGCTSLVRATLRSGVSTVGINAFSNCSALARVRIPLSVTAVLDDAFGGCGALEAAIYAGTKDDWSKKVTVGTGNDSLTGALRCTWSGACGRDLTWTFCNGTLTISGKGAMPDYDEHRAPWHDYINGWLDIKDVIVEEGVTYIGAKAFYGYGIDTLDIPVSVASIGKKVLYTPWIDVYYHGSEEQRKSIDGVNMIDNDYLWLSIWHDGCGRGTCGEELEWTFRDGVLAVNGWGWMDDYGSSSLTPWAAHRDVMTKLVVGEGVRSIGNSAFGGAGKLALVTLPASLKAIGNSAFGRGTTFEAVYYGGGTEDREAIGCKPENQRLINSPWLYYCNGPVTVSGKKADDAGTKLAWSVRNAQSGSLLIIARYDPAGKMENVELVAIERSEDGLIDLSSFEADSVFRFMLVDSKTFAPLCEVCSYTVNFEYEL